MKSKNLLSLNYKLVLGSKSPRRAEILRNAGLEFVVRTQDVSEDFDETTPVTDVAEILSVRKANELLLTLTQDELLITADSVVILDGIIYNKPADFDDAVRILTLLSGRTHTVVTGVTLITKDKIHSFSSVSKITFDTLTKEEIHYYIHNYQPFDKAGAYGIQDWIGLCKVSKIEGSYSNIMGLPMRDLYKALKFNF